MTVADLSLTAGELKILRALDAEGGPDKQMLVWQLRRAARLTMRGAGRVLRRMRERCLIAWCEVSIPDAEPGRTGHGIAMTLHGRRALQAAEGGRRPREVSSGPRG